jgi:hypothetical protein
LLPIEKTIDEFESDVNRMRSILKQVSSAKFTFTHGVTPMGSPELSAKEANCCRTTMMTWTMTMMTVCLFRNVVKKAKHGFSLND